MSVPGTSNRRRGKTAFLILGAVAALAVFGWFFHGWLVRDQVSTDNAQIEADVVPVSARVGGTLAHARAALVKAKGDLERAKALRQEEAIPARDLEAAQAANDAAKADVASAEARLTAAREQRHLADTRIAEAQGKLEQSGPVND